MLVETEPGARSNVSESSDKTPFVTLSVFMSQDTPPLVLAVNLIVLVPVVSVRLIVAVDSADKLDTLTIGNAGKSPLTVKVLPNDFVISSPYAHPSGTKKVIVT